MGQVFQEIRPLVGRSSGNAPFGWIVNRQSIQSDDQLNNSENLRNVDIESSEHGEVPSPSYARQLSTSSAPARTLSSVEAGITASLDDATTTNNVPSQSIPSLQQQNSSYESSSSATTNGNNENDPANENDSLAQIPEARAFINTVSRYFPYVCILFAKSCYDHLDGE